MPTINDRIIRAAEHGFNSAANASFNMRLHLALLAADTEREAIDREAREAAMQRRANGNRAWEE